jgi:TnpA family transposase
MLKVIGQVLLDKEISDDQLRHIIFNLIETDELKAQIEGADAWLSGKFSHAFNLVINRFSYLRQYSPSFLANIQFESEAAFSGTIINAIDLLRGMNQENKRKLPEDAPLEFMSAKLQKVVAPHGIPNRQAWECALLVCLRDEIRSGNLGVAGSKRYGRFYHFFISDREWEQIRQDFFQRAHLPSDTKKVEEFLKNRLNTAYDQFLARHKNNHYARIENNRWALSVDPSEEFSQAEKFALENLQSWLASHMRSIKLPELLIEVDNDLHFTNLFMLASQKNKRPVDDVCAILVTIMAHGCFIGPYTMARLTQGISYEQIRRVTDWQMNEDSQRLALASIVNAIAKIDVSQHWGEGKTSSSDGQRFEFKRKSLAKTYSTKFGDFALEFYTFVADNYAPFYSIPIECTDRDASYVLDGILYNESDLELDEHYTDTHGFTEINFAAFAMLGKKFSPRIKGVHHQRLYQIDSTRDYGPLAPLVSGSEKQIKLNYIVEKWDQMGQFYASLERGHATASTALKRLVGFSEKNHFYRANRDLGRIFKTENILEYFSDPLLRQNRRKGLLKGEQIHQLARNVAYGKRGKISVRDLHEQKNTCSCLTLILASIIYWQANEIKRVIDQYGAELDQKCLAMLAHISPIGWDNIILYGEYVLDKRLIKYRSYALNTYLGHPRYVLTASLTIPILASNQVKPV